MLAYVLRRAVALIVVLFVSISAMFLLLHVADDTPVDSMSPAVAADPRARHAVERRLGLDDPLVMQYGTYLGDLVQGDLGTSIYDGSSVSDQIAERLPVSLELGLLAALVSIVPGLLLGTWAALRHGRWADGGTRIITILAISIPSYWLAVLCLVLVGQALPDLLPGTGGFVTFSEDPLANLQVMILPAVVLGLAVLAMVARSIRASLIVVLSYDDVTFARAMGMPERLVMRRIALRNALAPTLAVLGVLIGGLVSGTILIENVFQIPGLGQLMVTAFVRRDYPLALGATVVTATIFLVLNLVIDVLSALVDPRTRRTMTTAPVPA
jgi:peptide/nickel transport system permease protein